MKLIDYMVIVIWHILIGSSVENFDCVHAFQYLYLKSVHEIFNVDACRL